MTPAPTIRIDLGCDAGEASTPDQLRAELALMDHVTSVHIACGGHAGDAATMRETVAAAITRNLAIGSHPSYPDREGFGRRTIRMDPVALRDSLAEQIAALGEIAADAGGRLTHLKPHGALYHDASLDPRIADAIADAASSLSGRLILVGAAGSAAVRRWGDAGLRVASEAFADRGYTPAGTLLPRLDPGSIITDPSIAAERALRIATEDEIDAGGTVLRISARTICVHADTPGAPEIARRVASLLRERGVQLASLAAGG